MRKYNRTKKIRILLLAAVLLAGGFCLYFSDGKGEKDTGYYLGISEKMLQETSYDETLAYFKKELEAHPRSALLCEVLASLYSSRQEYGEAMDYMDRGIEYYPRRASEAKTEACYHRRLLLRLFRFPEALACYKKMTEDGESVTGECLCRAQAEIYCMELDEAEAGLKKCLGHDSDMEYEVHDRLGYIHELRGDYAGALDSYRSAAALNPDCPYVQLHLGNMLRFHLHDEEGAKKAYDRCLKAESKRIDSSDIYWPDVCIHQAYQALGDKEQALGFMRLVLGNCPYPAKYFEAARLYAGLGEGKKALEYLEKTLEKGCCHPEIIERTREFDIIRNSSEYARLLKICSDRFREEMTFSGTDRKPVPRKAKEGWQTALDKVLVPDYFQKAKVHLYFRYIEPVAGHTVTAKWFPFDEECETGYVLISFRNNKTGKTFFYTSPKDAYYLSHDLNNITFAEGFQRHVNDTVYAFHYIRPDDRINKGDYGYDRLHPLGYHTPFQFIDVDFDGKQEVLLNAWDQLRGGNTFSVFKPEGDRLVEITTMPFHQLMTSDIIDMSRKTITLHMTDGAYDSAQFRYALKKNNASSLKYPKFKTSSADCLFRLAPVNERFRLVSVKEILNGETFTYTGKP